MSETEYTPIYEKYADNVRFHQSRLANDKAEFAMSLLKAHPTVAGVENGEDSAGRAKIRIQTVDEIVHRCCEIADKAFGEFESRGWTIKMPSIETINEERRKLNEEGRK